MTLDVNRLEQFIADWKDTPYLAGQCERGVGVDCLRYIDAALQYSTAQVLAPLPREAQDVALHNPEVVKRVARLMAGRFNMETKARLDPPYRPGEVLCVRTKTKIKPLTREEKVLKSPHHVLIVGPTGLLCWHAMNTGNPDTSKVSWVGVGGVLACYTVLQIWRIKA